MSARRVGTTSRDRGGRLAPGFPAAEGVRVPWEDVPEEVRRAIERDLGSPVVRAVTRPGGFSPGVAARLRLADGQRAFVKLVSVEANPDAPGIHRQEARNLGMLPADVPAPRLLSVYDDGTWAGLVLEDVEGREPRLPWAADDLGAVLDALERLGEELTPSPIPAPTLAEAPLGGGAGFARLVERPPAGQVDPWVSRHLERLVELEAEAGRAAAGDTLAHSDVRADNVLLTASGVVLVDWPWVRQGARWLDLALFLPSVAMQGGPAPWEVFDRHPVALGADREAVASVVAAVAGLFVGHSLEPAPPGLPTLRAFQAAQGTEAVAWLRRLTGWR